MSGFRARVAAFRGEFQLDGEASAVFPRFSPAGEEAWVPGWSWEPLHPPGRAWQRGQVFRTWEECGEAIWVVTQLDRDAHAVEYHRVEPGRYVARVAVRCEALRAGRVRVRTEYDFTGLSDEGNADIEAMSEADYVAKMERWRAWIEAAPPPP